MVNNLKVIGICLLLSMAAAVSAEAKNFEYQGYEIRLDQPEGELRYFDVEMETISDYYGQPNDPAIMQVVVPFIFCEDNTVYVMNLFGESLKESGVPVWMKGTLSEENIIFESGELYNFNFSFTGYREPVDALGFGRLNRAENMTERIEEPMQLVLAKRGEGYSCELPEDEGVYGSSLKLVNRIACKPSAIEYVFPPKGYPTENYQVNFQPATLYEFSGEASLLLKVIKTSDEIYIQGLSAVKSGNDKAWIKGEIKGNKIIFKNGVPIGAGRDGKNLYLTPMEIINDGFSTRHYHYVYEYNATGEDLSFDYDETTGRLYNPSSCLGFTSEPNESWYMDVSTEDFYPGSFPQRDFFRYMELIKVPENLTHETLPVVNNAVDYLDRNGYMMDPDNLYVKFFVDDEPLDVAYPDFNNMKYDWSSVFPFGNLYLLNRFNLYGSGTDLTNFQVLDSHVWAFYPEYRIPTKGVTAILYYSEDGEIPDDYPNAGIGEIEDDFDNGYKSSSGIYDLTGRRYESKDNLSPGLYIINGKKTLIK